MSEKEWDFILHLNWTGDPDAYQNLSEQILSRCTDGTISMNSGRVKIDFGRVAPTLDDAIRSAVRDIQTAGFVVDSVQVGLQDVVQWREAA